MTVSHLLGQPCNKFDNAISLLQVVNNLLQTWYSEHNLLTTCEQTCYNWFAELWELVRFYACMQLVYSIVSNFNRIVLFSFSNICVNFEVDYLEEYLTLFQKFSWM